MRVMSSNSNANILVVDDNEMNRDLITRRLKRQGYEAVAAENGRVALDLMEDNCFDLILLDIMMPVMNGYEMLEALKRHPQWQYIPVIVISAADDMRSVVKGIELGAEDYLPKPFNPMLLKARIRASLEKKRLFDKEQARLAEMATMQKIDAELNATLDVQRTMEITLSWAIKQSRATAGIMGEVAAENLHLMAAYGYSYEASATTHQLILPDELPAAKQACETGEFAYIPDTGGAGLLARTKSQLAFPLKRDNQIIAMLVLESDEDRQWEQELVMFLMRLCNHAAIAISNAKLYEAVQAADKAKTEFVSFVSHELKTPMTTIQGYTDLLMRKDVGDMNEMQMSFLRTLKSNVERMKMLVSDLEDVSRIEAGHLELEQDVVALHELVDEVLRSTKTQFAEKEQKVVLEVQDDLPHVMGDRNRLLQVLTNLVSNANKYTPEKGNITIRANQTFGANGHRTNRLMVQVSVSDTGLGIREEEQAAIFDKFFRANDSQAKKSPGTGLGLNITKNLVEMHNGRIWFESQYREGTTFHVMIPAAQNVVTESEIGSEPALSSN